MLLSSGYFHCLQRFDSSTSWSPALAPDFSLSVNGHSYGQLCKVSCYSSHEATVPLTWGHVLFCLHPCFCAYQECLNEFLLLMEPWTFGAVGHPPPENTLQVSIAS